MAYYIEIFILASVISFLFYKWATAKFGTFTERNIKHEKPLLLVGNTLPLFAGKESMLSLLIKQHEKFKTEKIFGFYSIRDPVFIARDPEVIKKIAIKDFDIFPNHRSSVSSKTDELISSMLTMLHDQKWKDMRTTLTPVFTGSKMRQIFQLINECGFEAVKYLRKEVKADGTELELKDFFTRYTVDVIASAAFGLKINSYVDKENEFYTKGRRMLKFQGFAVVKFLILSVIPQITKIVKLKVFNVKALNYLKGIVSETMEYRKKNKIIRQDMIHLLMESQKQGQSGREKATEADEPTTSRNANWTDTEIIAQCLLFFFAGFETVANALCFTAHELMKNPDVQEKLFEEISQMKKDLNGASLSYDDLKKMKYLDMVFSESLRKWPPAIVTDRICSKPYTLTDENGDVLAELKPGDNIWFSIIGSHHDPENFPDPYVFNPERFSDENKGNIKPFTYIPFGVGPRNCIANRFGLMEGKAMLYYLLSEFKFASGPKTKLDLMEYIKGFQMTPKDLFWLKLIPRQSNEESN